jgi:hypothetical protein
MGGETVISFGDGLIFCQAGIRRGRLRRLCFGEPEPNTKNKTSAPKAHRWITALSLQ